MKGYGTSGHMNLVALRSFFSIIKTCQMNAKMPSATQSLRNLVPLLASYSLKEVNNVLHTDSVLNHVSKGVYTGAEKLNGTSFSS